METKYTITIGWLYPDLMSTYGDRGNILVMQKKAAWAGISTTILPITQEISVEQLQNIDFIFGGGSQDIQQEIVMQDLMGRKGECLKQLIEKDVPALFVCGAPQLMGKYYEPAVGKRIIGLGVFDMVSVNPGSNTPRCIGDTIGEVQWSTLTKDEKDKRIVTIVGFENHGGRTYLGKNIQPFAKVIYGFGNNGEDSTEGMVYKNAIGCYYHGPFLPKNPDIADYLISKAIFTKYHEHVDSYHQKTVSDNQKEAVINLHQDIFSIKARQKIIKRYIKT